MANRQIPRQFELMGTTWKVQFKELLENKAGLTQLNQQIITIDSRLPKEQQHSTFLHEVLHVLVYLMGIDVALELNPHQEEVIVNGLSNGLFAAIRAGII